MIKDLLQNKSALPTADPWDRTFISPRASSLGRQEMRTEITTPACGESAMQTLLIEESM